jgi:hypothetical protein
VDISEFCSEGNEAEITGERSLGRRELLLHQPSVPMPVPGSRWISCFGIGETDCRWLNVIKLIIASEIGQSQQVRKYCAPKTKS